VQGRRKAPYRTVWALHFKEYGEGPQAGSLGGGLALALVGEGSPASCIHKKITRIRTQSVSPHEKFDVGRNNK
jgi:hypothetical protein